MRMLVVRGSFHSAGVQIGDFTKTDLPFVRDTTVEFLLENAAVSGLGRMREIAEGYLSSTAEVFPEAVAYLRGLAVGGGLGLEDVALIAFSEEIRTAFDGLKPEKCSTLAVPTARGWLIGHNEDYEPQYYGKMYALDLEIPGYPRVFSLNYSGHFPCLAGSLNRSGVFIANNSLWPDAAPGLSKNALHFRAALAFDLDEAVGFLARQPAALTGHYTVAWGEQDDLLGLEVSNPRTSRTQLVAFDPGSEPYWHANHARFLDLLRPDPAVVDGNHTVARGARLEELAARADLPRTPEALLDLLSADDGVLHRSPEQDKTSVTLATVVARPKTGEMWIRDADPAAGIRDLYLSFRTPPLN